MNEAERMVELSLVECSRMLNPSVTAPVWGINTRQAAPDSPRLSGASPV